MHGLILWFLVEKELPTATTIGQAKTMVKDKTNTKSEDDVPLAKKKQVVVLEKRKITLEEKGLEKVAQQQRFHEEEQATLFK